MPPLTRGLLDQIDAALYDLQDGQFTTINDYLEESYKNGYVGTFYSMKVDAGIPLVLPIRQDQVVKAIKTNSKLSKNLYDRLGEDVNYLKRSIRAELSRGITNGSTWNQMATKIAVGMNSPFNRAHSNAVRIARTEGHRIQNEAALDGMYGAKKKGADVVKQWDATLDGRTRDEHRVVDGQIRELDEPFDVGGEKMDAPGVGGSARNVCNCRCCLLQRAKWALDDDELDTLKERAEFFGLDKTKDFEEFKEKYLNVTRVVSYEGIPKTWRMMREGEKTIDTNPQKSSINCVNCTIAYEMRERGYAVFAGGANKKLRNDPFSGWVNPSVQKVKTDDAYSEIVNSVKRWGNGSRGQIAVLYKERNGIYHTSVRRQGHSFNVKNINGDIQFIDSQRGCVYNEDEVEKIFRKCNPGDISYAQTNNLDINDRGSHACKKE